MSAVRGKADIPPIDFNREAGLEHGRFGWVHCAVDFMQISSCIRDVPSLPPTGTTEVVHRSALLSRREFSAKG